MEDNPKPETLFPSALGYHKFFDESSIFFVGTNESSIFFVGMVWPTEGDVSRKKMKKCHPSGSGHHQSGLDPRCTVVGGGRKVACSHCHSVGVEPLPIGPGSARSAVDAEDPLDLPLFGP
jgi:hypothetical protein